MKLAQACEGCRKLAIELEDARHETLAITERLQVADDLARALGARLLDRHDQTRRLRAVPTELRGRAA